MSAKPRYNPAIHHRHSIRLPGYDYSQAGAYFITICTHNQECLFGDILVGAGSKPAHMKLNENGEIVKNAWEDLPRHINGIQLNTFGIMPNHIHGIISIVGPDLREGRVWNPPLQSCGLPEIVRQLKTFSARRINKNRGTPGMPVWQRNYYEHIIRNDKSYDEIACYITNNPMQWEMDQLFVRVNP